MYEPDSPSRKLIAGIMDEYFLVNVVHNDFKDTGAIFKPFFEVGEEFAAIQHTNGIPNGINGADVHHS